MQFNNTTTKDGLIQRCEALCSFTDAGISGNSTLLAQFTARLNTAYGLVCGWIWALNKQWRFDDSNYTDFPVSVTDLVVDQRDYTLPTKLLKLRQVEIMDANGKYYTIGLLKEEDYGRLSDNMQEDSGMPSGYYLLSKSIFIYPKPNASVCTLTNGLRLTYDRYVDYFATTDTTQEPGFAQIYHHVLAYLASIEYCAINDMVRYNAYVKEVYNQGIGLKAQIEKLYFQGNKEEVTKLSRRRTSYK